MLNTRSVTATAFVDWNSQIHNASPGDLGPEAIAARTLQFVCRKIGQQLSRMTTAPCKVALRVYHGWHKGYEPTVNRRALTTVVAAADFSSLSSTPQIQIDPNMQYGDRLISARPERLVPRLAIHLPGTAEDSSRRKPKLDEKMVDTAMAADVVDLAHRNPEDWILILAEDNDLVPPVFVAEEILHQRGRVLLMRHHAPGLLRMKGVLFAL